MCELFIKGDAQANVYTPRQTHPRAGGGGRIFLERAESLGTSGLLVMSHFQTWVMVT